jgi:hypothetical protein
MNDLQIPVKFIVDRLGAVKAEIAELQLDEGDLKAELIQRAANGPERSFEGTKYKAVVSFANKPVTDHEAVYDALEAAGVDRQLIDNEVFKATKLAESVPSVRVYAR